MPTHTDLPSGRIVTDDRGNTVWEWRNPDGTYVRTTDTQRLRALEIESYTIEATRTQESPDFTSYFGLPTQPEPDDGKPKRRTLDDMRRLSDEIKRKRQQGE